MRHINLHFLRDTYKKFVQKVLKRSLKHIFISLSYRRYKSQIEFFSLFSTRSIDFR